MVNTLAIILIIFSILQIGPAILVLFDKFDPLLPTERKKLPAKIRKPARNLNAVAMIAASAIFLIVSAGMLLKLDILLTIDAILFAVFAVVIITLAIKLEGKYIKKK